MSFFSGKRVLVTGACGTVGTELIRQLLAIQESGPSEVTGLDNHESELFFLEQQYIDEPRARFFVSDARDTYEMSRRMKGMDVVFHAAALKHVVLCERSPDQALQTNILGVQNVIAAAVENDVETVVFTSSDKAVNPTNVMGTSKLMGERLMTAANSSKRQGESPVFTSTRFGNVLGSSGSVVPIFQNQIAQGGPVTLTDREMTRFIMSIEDSVELVLDSAELACGGEVFITKMPVVRIDDMAAAMIQELAPQYGYSPEAVETTVIGTKPGEKLYEELMSDEETRRALELDRHFAVLPAFRGIYHDIEYDYADLVNENVENPYISSNERPCSIDTIRKILKENRLLADPEETVTSRYWPGDKEER